MRFECHLNMDNAAFKDNKLAELRYSLAKINLGLDYGNEEGVIYDTNGNRIGAWSITDERVIPPFPNKH